MKPLKLSGNMLTIPFDPGLEHADHVAGCQSEFLNCYDEASQRAAHLNAIGQGEVDALVAAGRFVVVEVSLYHCRATDAVAGSVTHARAHFPTRLEAESAFAVMDENGQLDHENNFFIAPREAAAARHEEPETGEEVPF